MALKSMLEKTEYKRGLITKHVSVPSVAFVCSMCGLLIRFRGGSWHAFEDSKRWGPANAYVVIAGLRILVGNWGEDYLPDIIHDILKVGKLIGVTPLT